MGPHTGNKACELKLVSGGPESLVVRERVIPAGNRSGGYQWAVLHRAIHGEALTNPIEPSQVIAPIRIIRAMSLAQHSGRTEMI